MTSLPGIISDLSEAEKFDLLDVLWEDLESHTPSVTPEQAEELDRRITTYRKDPTAVVSWEPVKAWQPQSSGYPTFRL